MKFFDKLKKRLFTLDCSTQAKEGQKTRVEETTQVNLNDFDFVEKTFASEFKDAKSTSFILDNTNDTSFKKNSKKVEKKQAQLKTQIEKQKIKRRERQQKIDKYASGLSKSGFLFSRRIKELQTRHNKIDEYYFEDLEESLIMSDIPVDLVVDIIDEIKKEVKLENVKDIKLINEIIIEKMFIIYTNNYNTDIKLNFEKGRVNIVLMVGVNGSGKTTSTAKLANILIKEKKKVLIAAADTFRAGAVEQLCNLANKIGCEIIKPWKKGIDPASVVFNAIVKAKNGNYDVLIIDTAGRLQNEINLMNGLSKINKIIQKEVPDAPHESLLVIDATTGKNVVSQAMSFKTVTSLTGLILTKMDDTSKCGIIFSVKDKLQINVKFIGLGESIDDLQEFDLDSFIYGMTKRLF